MKPFGLVVGGKSVEAVRHREVRNPATGEVVGLMPLATVADLDMAVRAAANAFESWKNVPGSERADACRRITHRSRARQPLPDSRKAAGESCCCRLHLPGRSAPAHGLGCTGQRVRHPNRL